MAKYSEDYEHRQYGPGSKYPYIVEQPDPVDPEFDLVLGKRVYKVVSSVSPDSKAACKDVYIFSEDEKGIEAEKRSAKWEANLLRKARHQHVVKLIMTYFKKNDRGELAFSIIMDRAEGNLRDRINKGDIQMRWFGCLINVVAYIHKIGIWHRDIKPENILVRKGEVLLADFGISKISTGRPVSKMKDSSQTPTGTANYLAPEVMGGTSTGGLPAEIFSLGAVFFEMAASGYLEGEKKMALRGITFNTGNSFAKSLQQVHDLMGEIIQRLSPESRDPRANISSVTIIDLCQKMLDVEPYKRPTAHDLCLWWNYHCRDSESTRCTCNNSNYAEPPDLDLSSTSLRRAYEAGHILMSQLLRDQNTQLEEGATLVAASKGGLWDVANYAAGITRNVRVVDESGRIALHYLASGDSQQCQSIAKKVLETDADLILRDDSSGKTPLRIAAESGNPNMIWELLKLKANRIQIEGRSPGDMVSEFLHRSSSVRRETHDHYRCEVLSGLLSSSPDFGTRLEDANALSQKATVYACKDILRLLETNGPINDLDSRGQTPLSIAAMYGHTAIVRLLLHMKVNINIEDINGRSPLSIAAIYGHEAIVRLLLERHTTNEADAAINKTDKSGRTLLSKVVDRGNPAIVKLLLDNRADITVVDNNGQTAMSRATLHGNNAIVTLLLDEDADLASGDPKTHKALIEMAAKQGHWVVETLLRTHTGLALTSPKPDESMVIEKAKGLIQQWKTFFRTISVFIVGRIIIVRRISKFFPEDWMMLLRMAGLFIMGGILSSSMMLYGIRGHLQLWDLTSNQTERI